MRKIAVQAFVTLDGVMQAPGGPGEDPSGGFAHGGWSVNYWDERMDEVMGRAMEEPYDLLLGRRTYDIFAAHWPRAGADPIAVKFNAARKYVATSSPGTLTWENSEALTGCVAAAVAALRSGDGPTLSVQGSSQLIQTLLANDLVDELSLWIFPLVLDHGKRLFGEGTVPAGFTVTGCTVSTTGVLMVGYRRSALRARGSFALETAAQ